MTHAYYSTVLDHPVERVWAEIRDFGAYTWAGTSYPATLEDGRPGDAVGCVRRIPVPDGPPMRQRLLAHSDVDRCYTYEVCEPSPLGVTDYRATLRMVPITDGDRCLAEWSATFECPPADRANRVAQFRDRGFALWLASLRAALARPPSNAA